MAEDDLRRIGLSLSEAHVLAVLAGVLFGCAAISTACWVWLRKQTFAFGGSALCGSGVVLLGLSIWHSVAFGVSGSSISLKLQAELEQKLKTVDTRLAAIELGLQQNAVAVANLKHDTSIAVANLTRATMNAQAAADRAVTVATSGGRLPFPAAPAVTPAVPQPFRPRGP